MSRRNLSRRDWLKSTSALSLAAAAPLGLSQVQRASADSISMAGDKTIDIGSRRELFVDSLLIGKLEGTSQKMHEPHRLRNLPARPFGHYTTVLKDGDKYRMYYRGDKVKGLHWKHDGWGVYHANEVTEYAESDDGFHWTEPDLGLYEIEGIPEGNVVLADAFLVTHNFSPFIDDRPGVKKEQRYKALGGGRYPAANWGGWSSPSEREDLRDKYGVGGLYAWTSPDGIHWNKLRDRPVIREELGNFDSQNVAFWSEAEKKYVCYYRWFEKGLRSIRRVTSDDFLNWTDPVLMKANELGEHLYTSGTHPYFRAPHIYIALPTRFQTGRNALTDVCFMSTRPGSDTYDRTFKEAFIRPGLGERGWGNRSNYLTWHVVPISDTDMAMYMYGGAQYVMRMDGFISIHAGYEKGEFTTKPLKFDGKELEVNFSTSGAGAIQVEIQDSYGKPLPGYSQKESDPLYGDEISRTVTWNKKADVSELAGKTVQLRFIMNEADLFSLKFH